MPPRPPSEPIHRAACFVRDPASGERCLKYVLKLIYFMAAPRLLRTLQLPTSMKMPYFSCMGPSFARPAHPSPLGQGLTLVHFSAQRKRFLPLQVELNCGRM